MTSIWIIAIAVLFNTINKIYTKFILNKVDSFSLLLLTNFVCSIAALPFAYLYRDSILSLSFLQIAFVFLAASMWSVNGYLGNLSTEKAEVSIREPLMQLQVIWAVFIGIIVFQESLNAQQILGIITIFLGSLILVFKKEVFKAHLDMKTFALILFYTIFTAIVAAMDKQVVSILAPQAYLVFNFFIPILFLLPFLKNNKDKVQASLSQYKHIITLSIIFFCAFLATLSVYKNFDFAIAYPLLKVASPLTAVAGIMLFNEYKNVGKKVLAILIVSIGVILVKVNFG